ncbi:hypothetical protein GCM10028789_23520 [Sinomonas halotolerans]
MAHAALAGFREAVARWRLVLAGKTALAAGLAWMVAFTLPGPAAQYPYYAPLGALVSMYPTVADSLRKGMQSLLGLTLGIGVAIAVGALTETNALSIALVIGLGVVLGGLPRMGTASDWVPMAALFVLVIGGESPDDFSLGYLLQMAVGVAIGFAVNWLILPPLHYAGITPAFARLRHALAEQLDDMAAALTEPWPPDHESWAQRQGSLAATASAVRGAVQRAEESATANPRRRRRRRDLTADLADLQAVEKTTFHVQDITDVLRTAIWEDEKVIAVPPALASEVAQALECTGAALRAWGESDDDRRLIEEAGTASSALAESVRDAARRDEAVTGPASVAASLARMVDALRARVEDVADDGAEGDEGRARSG